MPRLIFHVDLNSFFASAEQQFEPKLKGRPVGVIKGLGRHCIIACSDEAKTYGVKTGMNQNEARYLCPQIIFVPAQFTRYEQLTRRFIRLMHDFSDLVEVFSLDEVFLDVTETQFFFGGALVLAQKIQDQVQAELGQCLGVSIGISKNKFLAKLASGLASRRGWFWINNKNQAAVLAGAKLNDICGIGRSLSAHLQRLGIHSLSQIKILPQNYLEAEFGSFWAKELKRFSCGQDESNLITNYDLPKSVSRTFTLYQDTVDHNKTKALLRNLVEEACFKLRQMGLAGRQFGVIVRGNGQSNSGFITRTVFTDSGRQIFKEIKTLYHQLNWQRSVRFLGIWISLLTKKDYLPQPLFEFDQKEQKIWQTVDSINKTYGDYAVFSATMLGAGKIYPEVNGFMRIIGH